MPEVQEQAEWVPVKDLLAKMAKYNPRHISDKDMAALRDSLQRFGFVQPVVVNKRTDTMVAGHQRITAADLEGIPKAPVIWVDISEEEEVTLNLALNKISGDWDWDKLAPILGGLPNELQQAAGFAAIELEAIEKDGHLLRLELEHLKAQMREFAPQPSEGNTSPDAVPEVETFVKPGELWILDTHRLLCGDATNEEHVAQVLQGEKPALMVTDPPYGVNYDPSWRADAEKWSGISSGSARRLGDVQNDDRADWGPAWKLFPGDVAYVWHGGLFAHVVRDSLMQEGFELRNQIIWSKPHLPISRGHYSWQHEPCWYAVREGRKAHWVGNKGSTIWNIALDEHAPGRAHGTQKPVECMRRPMEHRDSHWVYEPFCGSGTTIIAAEQMDRRCLAIDIDPAYCSVAIRRWEEFTGKEARKE